MCGIVGVFRKSRAVEDGVLRRALDSIRHRGPDDEGTERYVAEGGVLALGSRRLSILDLSAAGHQPMHSANGRFTLVFNGEIFNYKELRTALESDGAVFRSQSDSEVLLEAWSAWGRDCLERFEGMFAFAVLDRQLKTLTCVRDPFGIKPLFYACDEDRFAFASEAASLWILREQRPEMDSQRCYDYLVHGDYDSTERTFVQGVRHLLPAHLLTVDLRSGRLVGVDRWWTPRLEERPPVPFEDAVAVLRERFLQTVRLHLRSDVPVGAALSGGIDSSALVCAMRFVEPDMPIETFSYVAPGRAVSEERWADGINTLVGARGHKVTTTGQDLARDLDDMIAAQGEPFGSTRIYAQYRVFQRAREAGMVVMLEGQGADEMVAGYLGYPGQRIRSLLESGGVPSAVAFARRWARRNGTSPLVPWLRFAQDVLPGPAYRAGLALLQRGARPNWIDTDVLAEAGVTLERPRPPHSPRGKGRRVIERMAHALEARELPALLRHGDRNAMRFSIENRVPFLTLPLATTLLGFPEDYLISAQAETKRVLRAAMRGIVPDAILDRTDKIGFATPDEDLLLTIAPRIRAWLADTETVPFVRTRELLRSFDAVVARKAPLDWRLWRWVNFARWTQHLAAA